MTTYTYSSLSDAVVTLPPPTAEIFSTSDQLIFDDTSISASELTLTIVGAGLEIKAGAKTITLRGFTQSKITSANFTFADSSKLIIGDNKEATTNDDSLVVGNMLIGTNFDDYMDGMKGIDTVSYAKAWSAVKVNLAAQTATGGAGTDVLKNIENVIGSNFNDNLTGVGTGSRLDGGMGIDTLTGAGGNDTYLITAGDVVTDSGGIDTVISNIDYVLATGLENLILRTGALVGIGNSAVNKLTGNSSDNVLDGGAGADVLVGLAGNDIYMVDDPNDTILEKGAGRDMVYSTVTFSLNGTGVNNVEELRLTGTADINGSGNALNNTIYANSGSNILNGDIGEDTLSYQFGAISGVTVKLDDASPQTTGGSGNDTIYAFENLIGSHYEDALTGDLRNNKLTGGEGKDSLTGVLGNDTLDGGLGNDLLDGGEGDDVIIGGAGQDSVTTGAGNDIIKFVGIADTACTTTSIAGVDLYGDLSLNNGSEDRINLKVKVTAVVANPLAGELNELTFVDNMNALLSSSTGFKNSSGGIDAAIVTASSGDLTTRAFLAVDLDRTDTFTATDFVIEVTGSIITSLTTATFI
ncbi:MAG: calcium-binding protein [Methylobacter sp.]|nr:MAG: calcium-binding protein [Methylobacter sp.]